MVAVTAAVHPEHDVNFRHEALFYGGLDEFVERTASFIRGGIEAGEPTLVVVGAPKIDVLRDELGDDGDCVQFADMRSIGLNPARIIQAWRDFVGDHGSADQPVRGIGEPISPDRSAAELVECERHEALLNLAFAGGTGWKLMCPYDTTALRDDILEQALANHPLVDDDGGGARPSASYRGIDAIAEPFDEPLPEPTVRPNRYDVTLEGLAGLRGFVRGIASEAGLDRKRTADFVLGVHELATNSIRHGGGDGTARLWRENGSLICDMHDSGRIDSPLAGRERPGAGASSGWGLWLLNQVCDLVQVRSFADGSVVRMHMRML